MVLLSALPCNDDIENDIFETKSISKIAQKNSQEKENCSPICLCSCCGQSIVEPQFITFQIKIPTLELENKSTSYHFPLQQRAQNIWQPPKLV